jgi:ABC-2 type transport system ATP-binding protein
MLISINNVSVKASQKEILKNISFNIDKGEVLSILGPNGSGKSTLIGIMLEDFNSNTGSVEYFPSKKEVFGSIGIVYDNQLIFPFLKIKEFIDYFASIYNIDAKAYNTYIDIFGLRKILTSLIKNLSQGERTKLAILLAIFHNPALLVLDEPFSGIDPTIIEKIWNSIRRNRNTIAFTSHDWEMAAKVSDKVIFLYEGTMVCPAFDPKKFKEKLPSDKIIVLPYSPIVEENLNGFSYYVHNNSLVIFNSDKKVLNKVRGLTRNFSILDATLKDVYFYLTYRK